MIDWKAKLTSRKFWMAVVGLVSGLLVAFRVDAETVETVSGVIMSAASVIAYIIGEGLADAAGAANPVYLYENKDEPPEGQDPEHEELTEREEAVPEEYEN